LVTLVEDNLPSRELLSDWLELQGFDVIAVADLSGAFDAFKSDPTHAVLLDVQLGKEDGLSLAKWIRETAHLRHTPVIAVTAHAMVIDQERVMQAGCNACVSKPVDFKLLKKHLAFCLQEVSSKI
jgi:DNA-binding response OmpR family regulator